MPAHKIATCCYCGTRATLVLAGKERLELSCLSCGAPLHNLKMLPKAAVQPAKRPVKPTRKAAKPSHPRQPHPRPLKLKKRKKRKGLFSKIIEEVWDEIEDIFD